MLFVPTIHNFFGTNSFNEAKATVIKLLIPVKSLCKQNYKIVYFITRGNSFDAVKLYGMPRKENERLSKIQFWVELWTIMLSFVIWRVETQQSDSQLSWSIVYNSWINLNLKLKSKVTADFWCPTPKSVTNDFVVSRGNSSLGKRK